MKDFLQNLDHCLLCKEKLIPHGKDEFCSMCPENHSIGSIKKNINYFWVFYHSDNNKVSAINIVLDGYQIHYNLSDDQTEILKANNTNKTIAKFDYLLEFSFDDEEKLKKKLQTLITFS